MFRKDRVVKQGGGIMLYVNNKPHAKIRPDLMTSEIEVLWIDLCPFKLNCSLFIAGVYRSPSSSTQDDASIAKNIKKVYLFGTGK